MDKIYREHGRMIFRYLLSLGAGADLAEELTQETFYQALKGLKQFRGDSSAATWLCGIAKNVYRSHVRKNPPLAELSDDAIADEVISWESLDTLEIIHRLPEPGREIVYLRLIGDLTFRQIGQIMGQSETWARVNFYRAKQRVVEELHETV